MKQKKWTNTRWYIATVRPYYAFICNFLKLTYENNKKIITY